VFTFSALFRDEDKSAYFIFHILVPRLLRNVKSQGRTSSHTSEPHKSYGSGERTVTSAADAEHLTWYLLMRRVLEKFTFVLMYLYVLKYCISYRLIINVTTRTTGSRVHNMLLFVCLFVVVVCFPGVTTYCGCIFTGR
jgi:hypothetical protein